MAIWERLCTLFSSNRRNLVMPHSNCANLKKAHSLLLSLGIDLDPLLGHYDLFWNDITIP